MPHTRKRLIRLTAALSVLAPAGFFAAVPAAAASGAATSGGSSGGQVFSVPVSGGHDLTFSVAQAVPGGQSPTRVSAGNESPSSASGDVTYHYLVTNTGTQPMTGIRMTGTQPGAAPASHYSCPYTTLASGRSEVCTASCPTARSHHHTGRGSDTPPAAAATPSKTQAAAPPQVSLAPLPHLVPGTVPVTG